MPILRLKGKLAKRAMEGKMGKGFPQDISERAKARLEALDAAENMEQIRALRGYHPMTKDRKGQHAIVIGGAWRICFYWVRGKGADSVEIVDYHP